MTGSPPHNEFLCQIALALIPGIGGMNARSLVAYCGSASGVFSEKERILRTIPGIGTVLAKNIRQPQILSRAEKELEFMASSGVEAHFFLGDTYPARLKACPDAPVILFTRGNPNLNPDKVISIVGTRNATEYGRGLVESFLAALAERGYDLQVVSGLAYGIDIQAHKSALRHNLPTVCVLAHGLETVYPSMHAAIAREMCENNGGIVSDFFSHSAIDRKNFLRRNRIIAGMADAVIVVESARKGGALLTAELAVSYNRDLFAFPGRVGETWSEGCHFLIKSNRAGLIENVEDLEYAMNWQPGSKGEKFIQPRLFADLTPDEQTIADLLRDGGDTPIDAISHHTGWPSGKISTLLLEMEIAGLVKCLPGKLFRLA